MQHRVVDLDLRVLELERHHVKDVLALDVVRDQQLGMVEPWRDVARRDAGQVRPGVDPAVAEDLAVLSH